MVIRLIENTAAIHELLVISRKRELLEMAAKDRRRLLAFCDRDRLESSGARCHPRVPAEMIHEVCALQKHRGHPRVVVFLLRYVAVGAPLALFRANGMRHERAER